jgi:outer membrane protein OmpA-like peptidoglycan-associated protein
MKASRLVMFGRRGAVIALAMAVAVVPGLSQTGTPAPRTGTPAKSEPIPGEYAKYEIGLFGGYQWFQMWNGDDDGRVAKLENGPLFGVRATQDLWNYLGLEESFGVGMNDLLLLPSGLNQYAKATARNYTFAVNPLIYFTPRQSRIRPFVTVGPGVTWYVPDKQPDLVAGAIPPLFDLKTKYGPSLNFGAGLKINASRRVGLRFDVRDMWTRGPHFGLPDYATAPGALYSPNLGSEHALQVTGGITFRFGHATEEAPAPPPPPPAPKPVANVQVGAISGARDVCPGEEVKLAVEASGWAPDQTPTYQWTVNGQPAPGGNAATFTLPTTDSGAKSIAVTVSVPGSSKTSDPVTVNVKQYAPPTVDFALAQNTVPAGTKVPLNATAKASECGGTATLACTASEGSISDNTFDTSSVAFDPAARLKQQSKTVQLTCTATDQKGGTGKASADLTVTLSPEARRLDDIVFPARSARVNNCAKRLLLEQLTPMLRDDPNATVVLVGHRDEREKGKAAANLDRMRTLNTAAVLSAGTGICPQLELSRVKVKWVGEDQTSPAKPMLCGTSTEVKERRGQGVTESDQRAQYRRVEVWIVPGGAQMPAELSGLQDAPAADVQKLGCPK